MSVPKKPTRFSGWVVHLDIYDPFNGDFRGNAWLIAKRELKKDDNSVKVDLYERNGHGKAVNKDIKNVDNY